MIVPVKKRRFQWAHQNLDRWLNTDSAEIAQEQLRSLLMVWNDAITNVPYYRKLVKKGKVPREIKSVEQYIRDVPVLTRRIIQQHPEEFVRDNSTPDTICITAGSTGQPLRVPAWGSEGETAARNSILGRVANGLRMDDRTFMIWGHSHLLGTGLKKYKAHILRKAKDMLLRCYRVNAYRMSTSQSRVYFDKLIRFRPAIITGYSSAVDALVRSNMDRIEQARKIGLKFVVATAEVFPRQDSKDVIQSFFACPLVMEYGGVEFGVVAHQMLSGEYRVLWPSYFVEMRESRDPAEASVFLTALYSRYVPLLRYDNGDQVSCPVCFPGTGVLKFSEVAGRVNDYVTLPDGTKIHSVAFLHCIHQEKTVRYIQLIQNDYTYRLKLVVDEQDTNAETRIRNGLSQLHPIFADMPIDYSSDLLTNQAGKRRWFVRS